MCRMGMVREQYGKKTHTTHKSQPEPTGTYHSAHGEICQLFHELIEMIESNGGIGNIGRRKWSCGVYDIPKERHISWLQLLSEHVLLNINSYVTTFVVASVQN